MILYHTGFEVIKSPSVHYGRRNADFGQGFCLTDNADFAHRWARERRGAQSVVNTYALDAAQLTMHVFERDEAWFSYLYGNRNGRPDVMNADVIIGPIANDTIYDTFGIITSGFLKPPDAMRLLLIGPICRQVALKTQRATEKI